MQNWDNLQTGANYAEHNNWYNNMFNVNIKTEPGASSPTGQTRPHSPAPSSSSSNTQMENFLKQQQQQFSNLDANMTALTPSPTNSHHHAASSSSSSTDQQQPYFDTAGIHQQLMQQQYQQHFQQAQQAAAKNQVSSHLPLGFNPLTPPGLPQAILPTMSHFYNQSAQSQRNQQQTPSPQSVLENCDKSALTPRLTPPMDITPPKSPKPSTSGSLNDTPHDQELMSNSSEDLKYIADSDDDETIRMPIYNSHGKMKNYKCKSCGKMAITKLAFWEHARTHMKPEKILQCPRCPFVTELKHHLEYHIRKHKNLKPFQCDKCSYSCVNKSMLNSHRKSHSSVYQYRCADCDYATKYCHSFKLHLRKYDHKPGMVLDEEGLPNPSVVIDVYGTRRGPKNKGSSSASTSKKSNSDLKMQSTSQLSAALQGFPLSTQNNTPASPPKSSCSVASELPALTLNMSLQQQQQQTAVSQMSPSHPTPSCSQNGNIPGLIPPLASLLQQNGNIAFFPYWNLNWQMLAAQQQAAVLAQLSPRLRDQLQQQHQSDHNNEQQNTKENHHLEEDEDEEDEEDQELDGKSVDSAMDLSQGTPTKDEQQQQSPDLAMNLKLPDNNIETPVVSSAARRKGRVLKLDHEQLKANQLTSAPDPPQVASATEMPTAASPPAPSAPGNRNDDHSSTEESMETNQNNHNNPSSTSTASAASSSGNSSNSSSTADSSAISTANSSPSATSTMFECKYCDILFKDAVLYTIHMGYHSCDDVFKCNMCGEKCDGPIGLFVHMARNAHS